MVGACDDDDDDEGWVDGAKVGFIIGARLGDKDFTVDGFSLGERLKTVVGLVVVGCSEGVKLWGDILVGCILFSLEGIDDIVGCIVEDSDVT